VGAEGAKSLLRHGEVERLDELGAHFTAVKRVQRTLLHGLVVSELYLRRISNDRGGLASLAHGGPFSSRTALSLALGFYKGRSKGAAS